MEELLVLATIFQVFPGDHWYRIQYNLKLPGRATYFLKPALEHHHEKDDDEISAIM